MDQYGGFPKMGDSKMIQHWLLLSMGKSVVWGPHILEHPPLCYSHV